MLLKFIFIFLLLTCQIQLMAQDDYIQEIKDYYDQVAETIEICKSSDELAPIFFSCSFFSLK